MGWYDDWSYGAGRSPPPGHHPPGHHPPWSDLVTTLMDIPPVTPLDTTPRHYQPWSPHPPPPRPWTSPLETPLDTTPLVRPGHHPPWTPPPLEGREPGNLVNERAVRILLEYILLLIIFRALSWILIFNKLTSDTFASEYLRLPRLKFNLVQNLRPAESSQPNVWF